MTGATNPILLVTAESVAQHNLEKMLRSNGYVLSVAATLSEAQHEIRCVPPVVILLDRALVRKEAIHRQQLPFTIPVILLRPLEQSCGPDDCVAELDAGFDLVFCSSHNRELLAHIRAMSRRRHMEAARSQLRVGVLVMDIARHEVTVAGAIVELTPKEFKILQQFLLSPGIVLSRQELLNRVWGEEYALEEHALDVHIHSLRRKIESDSSNPALVITLRGIGYKLQQS